jgi:hypothetical protein
MRGLDNSGVVRLLRAEVKRAGGQSAWARRERIDRSMLNRVLRSRKPPTEDIIRALKLCNIYGDVLGKGASPARRRGRPALRHVDRGGRSG